MITEKVKNTIINNNLIEKGEHIVIGLSGGPDSVCLFHILHRLSGELGFRLHAVHINHGLRPGAANEDQQYAEALCAEYGIPCQSFSFDVGRIAKEQGISSEDAGRQVRYRSFFETAKKLAGSTGHQTKVAVAQNMNDQAETVLMRIMRGTGTEGLCGIEYLREEKGSGVVIRPLLDVTREEIEAYCRENGLKPRIDLTNLEPIYTRNTIRLELLPYIAEHFNPNITAALNRLSKIAKEDKEYFRQKVEDIIAEHAVFKDRERAEFPLENLRSELPAVRHRIIMKLFDEIGLRSDIAAVHLEQADRLLREAKTSTVAEFSNGYVMEISYETAGFYKKSHRETMNFEYGLDFERSAEIPELNAVIGVKILGRPDWEKLEGKEKMFRNGNICRLSLDKIRASGMEPVLRTRRPGDYIVPLGMTGRKKLQDHFTDEKYSREERDRIPILCIGSEVVWIAGGRISENFKVEEGTERIIILEYSTKR